MENNKNMSYSKAFSRQWRAMRDIHKLDLLLFPSMALEKIMAAIKPYMLIFFSAQILNELAGPRRPDRLQFLLIALLMAEALMSLIQAVFSRQASLRLELCRPKYQKLMIHKQWTMDFSDFDKPSTHDLKAQISQNENWAGYGFYRSVTVFPNLVEALAGTISAVILSVGLFTSPIPKEGAMWDWLRSPIFVFIIPAIMLGLSWLSGRLNGFVERHLAALSDKARLGNRIFGYFGFFGGDERDADIRMYNQYDIARSYFLNSKDQGFGVNGPFSRYIRTSGGLISSFADGLGAVFVAIIYIFTCLKAMAGAFGVGSITQYVGAATSLSGNLTMLFSTISDIKTNAPFLDKIYELLDMPTSMDLAGEDGSAEVTMASAEATGTGLVSGGLGATGAGLVSGGAGATGAVNAMASGDEIPHRASELSLEFSNVTFSYLGTDKPAIDNLSIKLSPGRRLAIVGENGSGKTTFIKLLCRLYDPDEGKILVNGKNIKEYGIEEYRSIFSIVFQDFHLISQPLAANVAGSEDYDEGKLNEVLNNAGFGQRLESLPQSLQTLLYREFGDKGVNLSGGEAQKVAIARALYRNAPILILDEPTAALDPIAEAEIYSFLNQVVHNKTSIYISHRLSSCRFCDEILVFDRGKIIQQGSHDDLVKDKNGKYYKLWQAQAQYYV